MGSYADSPGTDADVRFAATLKAELETLDSMGMGLVMTGQQGITKPFASMVNALDADIPNASEVKLQAGELLQGLAGYLPADERARKALGNDVARRVDAVIRKAVQDSGVDIPLPDYSGASVPLHGGKPFTHRGQGDGSSRNIR